MLLRTWERGRVSWETLLNFPNLPEDTCNAVKYLAGQIETIDYFEAFEGNRIYRKGM